MPCRAAPQVAPVPRAARRPALDDRFFRHIVISMRNGVLAFTPRRHASR